MIGPMTVNACYAVWAFSPFPSQKCFATHPTAAAHRVDRHQCWKRNILPNHSPILELSVPGIEPERQGMLTIALGVTVRIPDMAQEVLGIFPTSIFARSAELAVVALHLTDTRSGFSSLYILGVDHATSRELHVALVITLVSC